MLVPGEASRALVDRVLDMQRDATPIRRELRALRRVTSRELSTVARFLFELLQAAQLHGEVEVVRHGREIDGGVVAGIHVLVRRAIRDVQSGPGLPVIPCVVDHAEAGAREDVDRLLAMAMPAGAPARGDLRLQQRGALGRETRGLANEHRRAPVLRCLDPREIGTTCDNGPTPHGLFEPRALVQPSAVEVGHRPMVWRDVRVSRPRPPPGAR